MYTRLTLAGVLLTICLSACTMYQAASNRIDYKDLKTMVIDILKTEDAQKTIQSSSAGSGMQAQSFNIQQQEQIRMAVKDTLLSPDYKKTIEKVMTEPKFAGEFAKVISKENKNIHKELMKDPEYQQAVGAIMKSPDMMKSYLDIMKTPEYRKQLMTIVKDLMNSPLFKLEIMGLLSKVLKEELELKEKGGSGEKGEGEE